MPTVVRFPVHDLMIARLLQPTLDADTQARMGLDRARDFKNDHRALVSSQSTRRRVGIGHTRHPNFGLEVIDVGTIVAGNGRERIAWAELWRVPKTLEDLKLEIVQLGDLKIWNGQGHDVKTADPEQLAQAFIGIKLAWEATCNL